MMKLSLATLVASGLCLLACDSSNPVDGDHEEHLTALGTAIVQAGDTLVIAHSAEPDDVLGQINLYEGESLEGLEVLFLSDHGEWFLPSAAQRQDHALTILHNQLDLQIEVDPETWIASMQGLHAGETLIRVEIEHGGHADYLSPELTVVVEESAGTHGPPVGMNLLQGDSLLLTADANREVWGGLWVPSGEQSERISLWFFDEDSVLFQPGVDHFPAFTLENPELMEILHGETLPDGAVWDMALSGLQAGEGTLVIDVMHADHTHYTSPALSFVVE
jgi:hypothetical protein